ncbi:hypothetical protein WJX72_005645 [[Myrmecia] bisecta]|uniref:Uncharacterized protein n=1 Tax=[Myrmecia] bisecta TaxID=41462 RepID=A0AAW1QA71_9CHLO
MLKCFPCCGLSVVPEEAAQPTADLLAADNQVDAAISAEALRVHNKRLQRCANSLKVNGGRLFLSGVFAQANTVTKNKRIYPKAVLQQEVLRFYKSHVVPGTAFGELDHPSYRSATFQQLHCATLSHQVLALWWRGDELYGIAEVLDTPAGRLARELYMRGYCFGASSRGWSSVAPEVDVKVVLDDLQLITFDLATNPASGAYLFPVSKRFQKPFDRQPAALELCAQQFPGVMPMFPSLDASGVRDARQIQQSMQVDPVSDTARRLSRMMQLLEVMRAGFNPGMPLAMSTIMQATASPIKKPVSPAATGTLTAYREPMLAW